MKVTVLLGVISVASVGITSAAPLCTAIGSTMDAYVAQGSIGCTIGDKLFSNFLYGSTGRGTGVAVPASAVTLTPVGAGTFSPGPGIIFSSNAWLVPSASASTNSFVDSSISFTVSVLNGELIIDDGTLTLSSFAVSGTGTGRVSETISPGGIPLQVSSSGPLVSHAFFTPTNSISVLKDLLVAVPGGVAPGSAQVFSFEEDFSQVPEPVGLALVGSGLLAIGFWRRRR
jgi:hypothetical protein